MSDLVKRLRQQAEHGLLGLPEDFKVVGYTEAADRIDALEADNKALREGLRGCLNYMENTEAELGITLGNADRARALLAKEAGE